MERIDSIRRYREQVLNAAALIAAIAGARFAEHSLLRSLASRHDDQLSDLLHDLAFRTRKLIELSDEQGFDVRAEAERRSIPGQRHSPEAVTRVSEEFPELYSLTYVLSRLIHSREFSVEREHVQIDGEHYDIKHELPWGFSVRSNYDDKDVSHFIWIDFLLDALMAFDQRLAFNLRLYERSQGGSGTA